AHRLGEILDLLGRLRHLHRGLLLTGRRRRRRRGSLGSAAGRGGRGRLGSAAGRGGRGRLGSAAGRGGRRGGRRALRGLSQRCARGETHEHTGGDHRLNDPHRFSPLLSSPPCRRGHYFLHSTATDGTHVFPLSIEIDSSIFVSLSLTMVWVDLTWTVWPIPVAVPDQVTTLSFIPSEVSTR